jgi:hypothetical protein
MEADSQIETLGTQSKAEGLLTKLDLAARLQLSPRTIDTLMSKRLLPFIKVGQKTVRFRWPDVVEKLKAHRVN